MKVSISGAIEGDRILSQRVRRASQILEQEIGPTTQSVVADWQLTRDTTDSPQVLLVLSDFTGVRAERRFAPDELVNEGQVRAKLFKTWGDLLQDRSHRQLDVLSGRVQSGE